MTSFIKDLFNIPFTWFIIGGVTLLVFPYVAEFSVRIYNRRNRKKTNPW